MKKDIIFSIVTNVSNVLSHFIPKSRKIWIYGAWSGQNYSDNPKYMFEYMNTNHPEIKSIWISRNNNVINQLKQSGKRAYNRFSIAGLYYTFRAGVAFETAGNEDISPFINNKLTKTIMMWHGVGGKSSKWKYGKYGKAFTKFKDDYFPASSQLYVEIMAEAKNVPFERFRITGQARDDAFVIKPVSAIAEKVIMDHPGKTFLIYMPTHRNFGNHKNDINAESMVQVDSILGKMNCFMVIKPHFHELRFYRDFEHQLTNIIIAKDDAWNDPYEYLHYFDMMISDYSSCMYDYLCSGKPIILYTYDINDFIENDANLHESFWKYPIGPMCDSWEEVLNQVRYIRDNDSWKDKREKCFRAFHDYNDGKNCNRIFEWVNQLLK